VHRAQLPPLWQEKELAVDAVTVSYIDADRIASVRVWQAPTLDPSPAQCVTTCVAPRLRAQDHRFVYHLLWFKAVRWEPEQDDLAPGEPCPCSARQAAALDGVRELAVQVDIVDLDDILAQPFRIERPPVGLCGTA
jgi:hypothetical protein